MSSDTNPHELIAQYRKAQKLAAFLHSLGVEQIDPEPSDEMRDLMRLAADLATVPSRAVVALAAVLLHELILEAQEDNPDMPKLRALMAADLPWSETVRYVP